MSSGGLRAVGGRGRGAFRERYLWVGVSWMGLCSMLYLVFEREGLGECCVVDVVYEPY